MTMSGPSQSDSVSVAVLWSVCLACPAGRWGLTAVPVRARQVFAEGYYPREQAFSVSEERPTEISIVLQRVPVRADGRLGLY